MDAEVEKSQGSKVEESKGVKAMGRKKERKKERKIKESIVVSESRRDGMFVAMDVSQ